MGSTVVIPQELNALYLSIFSFLSVYFIYRVIFYVLIQLHRHRLISEYKCQPVANTFGKWPLGLDFISDMKEAQDAKTLPQFYEECFEKAGNTWAARFLNQTMYFTCEPEILTYIMSTHHEVFPMRCLVAGLAPLLGTKGVMTIDGPDWEHSRALLRPQFSRGQVTDYEGLEKHFRRLLSKIFTPSNSTRQVAIVDVSPLFLDLRLHSSTEFLFGEDADSLFSKENWGEDTAKMTLSDALQFAEDVAAVRAFVGVIGSWIIFGRDAYTKFHKACKTCQNFCNFYVDKAIRAQKEFPTEKHESTEKTKKYVALNEFAKITQDRELLRDNAVQLLIAGRDTTAYLWSWAVFVLARKPHIFAKLKEEVVNVFGEGENCELPTYSKLKNLQYVSWVVKETLRLYPVVPFNRRVATEDIVLPVGGGPDGIAPFLLRKGQVISYSMYSLHRRKDLYGEDADEFRPERWGEERIKHIGWGYFPFGGGPRVCIGQKLAMNEASYVLARLAQTCRAITVPPDVDPNEPLQYEIGFAMANAKGVRVQLMHI